MKPTFLSKTLSALSLIATLAVVIGTNVTQSAEAQTQREAGIDAEFCINAQSQDIGFGDSTAFFEGSRDIDVSAAQIEEFEAVITAITPKLSRIDENAEVTGPGDGLMFTPKVGIEITPEQMEAINAEAPAIYDMTDSPAELVALFNANETVSKYGRYSEIQGISYTPEQVAQRREIFQERDAQFFAILTPEQQQQFQNNTEAINRRNEAYRIN